MYCSTLHAPACSSTPPVSPASRLFLEASSTHLRSNHSLHSSTLIEFEAKRKSLQEGRQSTSRLGATAVSDEPQTKRSRTQKIFEKMEKRHASGTQGATSSERIFQ